MKDFDFTNVKKVFEEIQELDSNMDNFDEKYIKLCKKLWMLFIKELKLKKFSLSEFGALEYKKEFISLSLSSSSLELERYGFGNSGEEYIYKEFKFLKKKKWDSFKLLITDFFTSLNWYRCNDGVRSHKDALRSLK